jgi:hypothetical protein
LLGQEPAARPSFAEWLAAVRAEAVSRGLREEVVDAALADVTEPQPVILERDRAQAETVFSLEKYITRILKPKLILGGREAYAAHRELLDQVSERYGVPPRIIAGIWGLFAHTEKNATVVVDKIAQQKDSPVKAVIAEDTPAGRDLANSLPGSTTVVAGSPAAARAAQGPILRRRMRICILEILALPESNPVHVAYHALLTKQFASVMPQVVSVWCRQLGHQVSYAIFYGVGDPLRLIPADVETWWRLCSRESMRPDRSSPAWHLQRSCRWLRSDCPRSRGRHYSSAGAAARRRRSRCWPASVVHIAAASASTGTAPIGRCRRTD